jgi:hypothetical protein
MQTDSDDE